MSWASRRKAIYGTGVALFFATIIGVPLAYWYFTIPPTCTDGIQNQDETAIDRGGICPILDERALQPHATLWARSFRVRDGSYNAAAYIQNPNQNAGVRMARYRFGLYDAENILVAERDGTMFIMPGAITPVLESRIDVGNRIVARTYFQFLAPLTWERMQNNALPVSVTNKELSNTFSEPRLSASVRNSSVADILNLSFIAVIFDPAGNAFAASATTMERLTPDVPAQIVFTWPDPFAVQSGRIDIISLVAPSLIPPQQ